MRSSRRSPTRGLIWLGPRISPANHRGKASAKVANDGSGQLRRRIVHGPGVDEPIAEDSFAGATPTRQYLHADHQGGIRAGFCVEKPLDFARQASLIAQ